MGELEDSELKIFCQKYGISIPYSTSRIRAGRNSDVLRIFNQNGQWILKKYFSHNNDNRDRIGTEFGFLTYLENQGISSVPRPLGIDKELLYALYSHLAGERPNIITTEHISQAANFIKSINTNSRSQDALMLPAAADACLSMGDHMELIASRIDRLLLIQPKQELEKEVHKFVKETLLPCWQRMKLRLLGLVTPSQVTNPLAINERIISPSDFGFHNALDDNGKLFFLDFEYAGWDDPAKLICDFICQPELPVTKIQGQQFIKDLGSQLHLPKSLYARVELLLPLHRLKWCCILLNEFRSEDRKRRLHAGIELEGLLANQFSKAKSYFSKYLAVIE